VDSQIWAIMQHSLLVSVDAMQGGSTLPPHVAVWQMSARTLPCTEPNALEYRLVSGRDDHIESTTCDVCGACEPDGHRGQEVPFEVGRFDA
jgi:hypothetical protein